MASEKTIYTKNRDWKVEVEAWRNHFFFYTSIGTEATVYHKEKTKNIWGNTVTDWVKKRASNIHIRNIYSDDYNNSITKEKSENNCKYLELKEWAVGFTINLNTGQPGSVKSLTVSKVEGRVTVIIEGETLSCTVSASSYVSDNSIW